MSNEHTLSQGWLGFALVTNMRTTSTPQWPNTLESIHHQVTCQFSTLPNHTFDTNICKLIGVWSFIDSQLRLTVPYHSAIPVYTWITYSHIHTQWNSIFNASQLAESYYQHLMMIWSCVKMHCQATPTLAPHTTNKPARQALSGFSPHNHTAKLT